MATDNQKVFGLIGYPLGHSFSKDFFNKKFEAENINARYINFEIPRIEDIEGLLGNAANIYGLNVTIPYKEKVIPYLDSLDEDAQAIGAVNVVRFMRNSRGEVTGLRGYNSDVIGFCDSIRALLKPWHKKALVLGTGGAAKAVHYGLLKLGVAPTYVSRTPGHNRLTYHDLTPEVMAEHTVIVNTTPLGMYPNIDACPDIPYGQLTHRHLCYDVLYNPDTTLFMQKSAAQGACVKNGLEMLLMQAFAAWNIWNLRY